MAIPVNPSLLPPCQPDGELHKAMDFQPISCFSLSELDHQLGFILALIQDTPCPAANEPMQTSPPPSCPRFESHAISSHEFTSLLHQGLPSVIGLGVQELFQPGYFSERYSKEPCQVITMDGIYMETSIGTFFKNYGQPGREHLHLKLKVCYFPLSHFFKFIWTHILGLATSPEDGLCHARSILCSAPLP